MYDKTIWKDLEEPAINAANLNKIEDGIKEAHDLAAGGGENRPSEPEKYQCFFDEQLNPPRPIWWRGDLWVDAAGAEV